MLKRGLFLQPNLQPLPPPWLKLCHFKSIPRQPSQSCFISREHQVKASQSCRSLSERQDKVGRNWRNSSRSYPRPRLSWTDNFDLSQRSNFSLVLLGDALQRMAIDSTDDTICWQIYRPIGQRKLLLLSPCDWTCRHPGWALGTKVKARLTGGFLIDQASDAQVSNLDCLVRSAQ